MQNCILAVHMFAASNLDVRAYVACMSLTAARLAAAALQPVRLQAAQMLDGKHAPTEMSLSRARSAY